MFGERRERLGFHFQPERAGGSAGDAAVEPPGDRAPQPVDAEVGPASGEDLALLDEGVALPVDIRELRASEAL